MNGRILLDTNILVYAFDGRAADKQAVATRLLDRFLFEESHFISSQVLAEFCSVAQRKLEPVLTPDRLSRLVQALPDARIVPVTKLCGVMALELQRAHRLSFWDALLLATAVQAGCEHVLSEDMQHGMHVQGLTIVNPFVEQTKTRGPRGPLAGFMIAA